jgi:hypothetical protein
MLPFIIGGKMKRYIGVFLTLITAAAVILFSACSSNEKNNQLKNIERPDTAATGDEAVEATAASDAVELSENVNGVRFNLSLHGFTQKYNSIIKGKQGAILLKDAKWKKAGDAATDDNDVKIQYWYYDDENVSFTATEELASGKHVASQVTFAIPKANFDENLPRFEHVFANFPEANDQPYVPLAERPKPVVEQTDDGDDDDDWRQYL